jgi:hypothetical protein
MRLFHLTPVISGLVLLSWVCSSPCSVPDPSKTLVEWRGLMCDNATVLVCPRGDGSWIFVRLNDQFGLPVPGVLVSASFAPTCSMYVYAPSAAITDVNGAAYVVIRAGLDRHSWPDSTVCCVVQTSVTALGVTLFNDTRDWLSPDLWPDFPSLGVVEPLDYVWFCWDYMTASCWSDFDCDGVVDTLGADHDIFVSHWLHFYGENVGIGERLAHRKDSYMLSQSWPNPSNPRAVIECSIRESGLARLIIFDTVGHPVRVLVDRYMEPGTYKLAWDGRAENGAALPPGVYFYRLEAGGFVATRKLVLLR